VESKVLFVAEAPGRLGADRTGVPLFGDRTGDNFEALLGNIGWRREQVFITNAVLCNPKQDDGNNDTPTAEEIAKCSAYLEMVITLVNPDVIVTLGVTALDALNLLSPHGIELREGVAQLVPWRGTRLFPLYHPGNGGRSCKYAIPPVPGEILQLVLHRHLLPVGRDAAHLRKSFP
jgi:uracil-DNA glycosylase family 4